ncbi:MAG: hypothetical protein CMI18_01050 [Opitutaceae bacterium]|mgnify:CR=1 FL=1|nr:hypothetical protein [Opitutaceae bacterium]|tara:strand:- start:1160 stop:2371 length:1212 start_codon:yes stop_codon:yes gene_type:complete
MSFPTEIIQKTFFWDRVRGAAQGVLETGYTGLALIIAIEVFQAPNTVKSLIAAANPSGLILTPLTLGIFAWISKPAGKIARILMIGAGIAFLTAGLTSNLNVYLIMLIVAGILGTQMIPLLTHIYAENYPPNKRGTYLSLSFRYSVVSALLFSIIFGHLLDLDTAYYTIILGSLSLACVISGISVGNIPTTEVPEKSNRNPLRNMSYAIRDWKFGIMLFSWMFSGLGNLMVMPLRFEYLLQPEYGIEASNLLVAWITLAIPAICRFLSAKFWGRLFDDIDFMILRTLLNAMQMISILLFFKTTNIWALGVLTALNGFAMGGGNLSWSLWVTKFAPKELTAAYMSVHTFLTGIRGSIAPFFGFFLLTAYGAVVAGSVAAIMILFSIVLILFLFFSLRKRQAHDT